MAKILAEATKRRRQSHFSVAMNYGIAKGVLGLVPPDLEADMTIANRIAPTLSRGLRGNPRQLKRFLNTLLLRSATAGRREVTLDPAVLAKLMVLEQQETEFQQLFLWQLNQDGAPEELVTAEQATTAPTGLPTGWSPELTTWFSTPAVRAWLGLEPPLAGVPLGEFFFFSRDRLSPAAPGARLSAALQDLLGRLRRTPRAQRRTAVEEAASLGAEEFSSLYDALLDRARRKPGDEAMTSAIELTAKVPTSWPALTGMLGQIPEGDVPAKLAPILALLGKGRSEVDALFDRWETSSAQGLRKAVGEARKDGG